MNIKRICTRHRTGMLRWTILALTNSIETKYAFYKKIIIQRIWIYNKCVSQIPKTTKHW